MGIHHALRQAQDEVNGIVFNLTPYAELVEAEGCGTCLLTRNPHAVKA